MATPTNTNGNLVEEFEEAFQNCLNVLTKDEVNPQNDKDEIKIEADQTVTHFIDMARQMEAFFLQKRFLLSTLKPELQIKEEICDLRSELARKDELFKRHHEKIAVWQNLLADVQGYSKSQPQGAAGTVQVTTPGLPNGSGLTQTQPVVQGMVGATTPGGVPVGPTTPGQLGGPGSSISSAALQQMQHQQMQQAQFQQQQQMQAQLQQQQLQQLQQQQMQASFMQQGAGRGGQFGQGGPGPMSGGPPGSGVLQGPLAYLEKTTSNIDFAGISDGRR